MKLNIQNIGLIDKASIKLDGLTVVCGDNGSGKSTISKALFSTIESFACAENKFLYELAHSLNRVCRKIEIILQLKEFGSILDLNKLVSLYSSITFFLQPFRSIYNSYNSDNSFDSLVHQYHNISDAISGLNKELLIQCIDLNSTSERKVNGFLNLILERKEKAQKQIDELKPYFSDDGINYYLKEKVRTIFSNEFVTQILPENNQEVLKCQVELFFDDFNSCIFNIDRNKNITIKKSNMLVSDVHFIDNPYVIDGTFGLYGNSDLNCVYHREKLLELLRSEDDQSIIEKSINDIKFNDLISKLAGVAPGQLEVTGNGYQYHEEGKAPIFVQNLATGMKVFSIIKTLILKGKINDSTLLILDEPESHLHPDWQNKMAEIVVLLAKIIGANVLLTTHSTNFLMAIDAYMRKYDMKNKSNFYLTTITDGKMQCEEVTENINLLYKKFLDGLVFARDIKKMYSNGGIND